MVDNIGFLANSQTFYGVLATLIVLCVFRQENSNFIFGFTQELKNKLSGQFKGKTIKVDFDKLLSSAEYKLVRMFLLRKACKPKLKKECLEVIDEIASSQSSLIFDNISDYLHVEDNFNRVAGFREQFLAPIYTLVYALLVFIADELIRWGICPTPLILLCLTIFTYMSIFYWTVLWIVCWLNLFRQTHEDHNHKWIIAFAKWLQRLGIIKGFICKYLFFLSLFMLSVVLVWRFDWASSIWPYIIGIIVPTFIFGAVRAVSYPSLSSYSSSFALGHAFALLLVAITYGSILFMSEPFGINCEILIRPISLKCSVMLFTIVNGLALPYLIPLFQYRKVNGDLDNKLINLQHAVDGKIKGLHNKLKAVSQKIP